MPRLKNNPEIRAIRAIGSCLFVIIGAMLEFTLGTQRKRGYATLLIATGLFAVILVGIWIYVRIQQRAPIRPGTAAVVVSDLLRPGNPDFEYYKSKVRIENVKATLGISITKARNAMITGTIVNDGDRRLEALELHVFLYDVSGNVSRERTAFALRPGAGYSGKPMEPLERRPFTMGVDSVELDWDPKQIEYEITGLRYK